MKHLLVISLLFSFEFVSGQSIVSLNASKIVELERVISPATETHIVASMQRYINRSWIMIHRSTDQGASWSLIDSIVPNNTEFELADPVLTVDQSGYFYLAFMRIHPDNDPTFTTVDVELYHSTDDGLSWNYLSSPHHANLVADYPQITVDSYNQKHLVYSLISGFPSVQNSDLVYAHSSDGITWNNQFVFQDSIECIGPDIYLGWDSVLWVTAGSRTDQSVYSFTKNANDTHFILQHRFENPNGEIAHITKPLAHHAVEGFGIISHKPHKENTDIVFHAFVNNQYYSQVIDQGAYAQGYMDEDGSVYLVYNKRVGSNYSINYIQSTDGGITFSSPLVLFSAPYEGSENGEYQSLLKANDPVFYLTFCDWSDQSIAKTLVFPMDYNSIEELENKALLIDVYPNPTRSTCTIDLPKELKVTRLKLIDSAGNQLLERKVGANQNQIEINLESLPTGVYTILLQETNRYLVSRIVVD